MRILLVGGQNIPGIGGVESYMYNMARSLIASGHDVSIVCSGRQSCTTTIEGIKIVHKICPTSNSVALPLLFLKSIGYICKHRKEIDVVNYQSILFAFLSGWVAVLCGCKVCYTIHSLPEDSPKYGKILKTIMKLIGFISIWSCGNNILTISKSKSDEIKSRYGKTCAIIPCGVQLPPETINSNIIEKFGLKRKHYYLTIGRIDPIKNLDILIEAFITKGSSGYQLVIAGDYANSYGEMLRQLASKHKDIVFVGSVTGDDKECLLSNCFANCLVSSSEGMPISLLEAMAYGVPCIVSDISAIREIMKSEWARWCPVRNSDALAQQMKQAELDRDIDKYKREVAIHVNESHSWDSIAKQYCHYLSSI